MQHYINRKEQLSDEIREAGYRFGLLVHKAANLGLDPAEVEQIFADAAKQASNDVVEAAKKIQLFKSAHNPSR